MKVNDLLNCFVSVTNSHCMDLKWTFKIVTSKTNGLRMEVLLPWVSAPNPMAYKGRP
jgi:hypothetical protein